MRKEFIVVIMYCIGSVLTISCFILNLAISLTSPSIGSVLLCIMHYFLSIYFIIGLYLAWKAWNNSSSI